MNREQLIVELTKIDTNGNRQDVENELMPLIDEYAERVALEARIDEVETPLVKIMAGDSDYISIEYFKRRLAELKAQKEEV